MLELSIMLVPSPNLSLHLLSFVRGGYIDFYAGLVQRADEGEYGWSSTARYNNSTAFQEQFDTVNGFYPSGTSTRFAAFSVR